MIMKPFLYPALLLAMLFPHRIAAAQDRETGIHLAYNELSAVFSTPLKENETLRLSLNLDMTNMISGDSFYPGVSAEAAYLFLFAGKVFQSGERMFFFAGPGANAGYVQNFDGKYGFFAALSGCVGFEYVFNVPVSLSLGLEPSLGLHVSENRAGETVLDFYRPGIAYALVPHVGIKYRF